MRDWRGVLGVGVEGVMFGEDVWRGRDGAMGWPRQARMGEWGEPVGNEVGQ